MTHSNFSYQKVLLRLAKLQGDPHYVALGAAIGVYIGFTPTIPFHTVLALVLAFILGGSKPASVIGTWIANPFTIPFFYLASYKTGNLIGLGKTTTPRINSFIHSIATPMPLAQKWQILTSFGAYHLHSIVTMLIGGIVLGVIPAVISYFVVVRSLRTFIEKRKEKNDISL